MDNPGEHELELHRDEIIVQVIELDEAEQAPDDLAVDLQDVDLDVDLDPEEDEMEAEAEQDDSVVTFSKHTGSVFCVSLDPASNSLAVTGGGDDRAFVWSVHDGEVLIECTGHKDSVTCAVFSHDSSMVASGDMSGLIKVWRVQTREEVWSFEVGDLEWLDWHPCAPVLLAGTKDGDVWMWKIPAGDCKTFQCYARQATCGKVLPDGKQAVVGYGNGLVRILDLKQGNSSHSIRDNDGPQRALTCLACNKDGSLVLTGSLDGLAKLINTSTGKVVGTFSVDGRKAGRTRDEESNSVESVGFCNILPLIAVAYLDGTLAIYDLPTHSLRHSCLHQAGIVRLQWEESSSVVSTCCLDGALRLWDARTGNMVSEYRGHNAELLDFVVNREATLAVTVSGDHRAKVFCLQRPGR